jgi:hypothetical protein
VPTGALLAGDDPRHVLLDDGTRLAWLADVVPVPLPLVPQVVSPGDVLVAAGLAQLVVVGMLARRPLPALPTSPPSSQQSAQGRQRRALPPLPQ